MDKEYITPCFSRPQKKQILQTVQTGINWVVVVVKEGLRGFGERQK